MEGVERDAADQETQHEGVERDGGSQVASAPTYHHTAGGVQAGVPSPFPSVPRAFPHSPSAPHALKHKGKTLDHV